MLRCIADNSYTTYSQSYERPKKLVYALVAWAVARFINLSLVAPSLKYKKL